MAKGGLGILDEYKNNKTVVRLSKCEKINIIFASWHYYQILKFVAVF